MKVSHERASSLFSAGTCRPLFLLFILFAALGAACSRPSSSVSAPVAAESENSLKYVIGFSNGFSGNSWRTEMLASLRQEACAHPEVELIIHDGQGDINKQVVGIEAFIARRVNAIILIPNSSQAVNPVLKRARALGIKVLHFNLPLDDPDSYDVYVGPDERERGRAWAAWLSMKLGGKGRIVMFGGIPGNPGTALAMEGALEVLQGTGIQVLAYRDAYWQEDRARSMMAELISRHPKIDGIWSDGGQMTLGALKALLDAGRPLVPATGDDYNGVFKLYLNYHSQYPRFDFSAIATPTWQSRIVLRTAVDLLKGKSVEKWIRIVPRMLTGIDAASCARPELPDSIFVDTDLPSAVVKELR